VAGITILLGLEEPAKVTPLALARRDGDVVDPLPRFARLASRDGGVIPDHFDVEDIQALCACRMSLCAKLSALVARVPNSILPSQIVTWSLRHSTLGG
jgi:hypothetical protein